MHIFLGSIHHIVKGYSSAVQFPCVIYARKAKIICGDFVHLLSLVKQQEIPASRAEEEVGVFGVVSTVIV